MAEGKNLYEVVIVTSAKLGEEGSAELVNKFKALIAEHGTVESVDDWGKRRFAYPITSRAALSSPPSWTGALALPTASCAISLSSGTPATWLP